MKKKYNKVNWIIEYRKSGCEIYVTNSSTNESIFIGELYIDTPIEKRNRNRELSTVIKTALNKYEPIRV
jgi:hypothetical protein|tara:strand:+ start:3072 stop:3278 length:207 start_codon:yes stop_codon:yes gene_type:complete